VAAGALHKHNRRDLFVERDRSPALRSLDSGVSRQCQERREAGRRGGRPAREPGTPAHSSTAFASEVQSESRSNLALVTARICRTTPPRIVGTPIASASFNAHLDIFYTTGRS